MKKAINKFSYIVNNAINEAFDFDNEISVEATLNSDMLNELSYYGIRKKNMEIPIKELFAGLYKIDKPYHATSLVTNISGVGPVWYPKGYWIPTSKSPGKKETWGNRISLVLTKFEKLYKAGWKRYCTIQKNSDWGNLNYPLEKTALPNEVKYTLNALAKLIGVSYIDWNSILDDDNPPIMMDVYISPDNGIIYIQYMVEFDNAHVNLCDDPRYNQIYPNVEAYIGLIVFTGSMEYKLSKNDVTLNTNIINEKKVIEKFIKSLCRFIGISLPWFSGSTYYQLYDKYAHNMIISDNGDLILPAGLEGNPFPNNYNIIKNKIVFDPNITPVKDTLSNSTTKIDSYLSKGFGNITSDKDCWNIMFNNKKTIIWNYSPKLYHKPEQRKFKNKVKIIMSTDIEVIRQIAGDIVAEECKKRPIALESVRTFNPKNPLTLVYKFIWFDDEILDIYNSVIKDPKSLKYYFQK